MLQYLLVVCNFLVCFSGVWLSVALFLLLCRRLMFDIEVHLNTWGQAVFYGTVLKSLSQPGLSLWLWLIFLWQLFQFEVDLCLPHLILKPVLWWEVFLVFFLLKGFIRKKYFKIVDFVVWPLIILQMTMFWLRNFALGITSFHMAMWWSFGNIFVHHLPFIVLFTLRIKFAFICHIFLFYMMSGR